MKTQCPHCHTIFNLTNTELEQADNQVRCGHCLAIFSAETFTDQPEINESRLEDTDVNQIELEDIPTITTNKQEPVELPDVVPPELRTEIREKRPGPGLFSSVFWLLAICTAISAGILQYAYYDRVQLVKHNELRPWLTKLCLYAKCELPEPRDPARIELTHKNVFTHPNHAEALMISATIVNQAEFQQAFPLIDIVFSNVRGQAIAGRRFTPEEYLNMPASQIGIMEPGEPVSFNIEIIDSGRELMSYEFNFL